MISVFEKIFHCSPVANILVNETGCIELVNQQAEELFQYSSSELIGKMIEILVPTDVKGQHPEYVKNYVASPHARQMGKGRVLFGLRKDGIQVPVEVGLNPIQSEEKMFVLCSVIDISERIKAEDRFKAAVEAAPNGMLMIDSKRKIILINKKIEEIFGYTREDLIGNTIEKLVPDDFKAPHPKFVESYLRKPEPRSMGIGRELFGRHKSGKLIPVEIGLQPLEAKEGKLVIASVIDISSRRQADLEIKHKTEEIQEFSYRTSHDLKSPLKSISALGDCITDCLKQKDYKGIEETTTRIKQLSGKLLTLIEDIMTLTKVEMPDEKGVAFDFSGYPALFQEKYQSLGKDHSVKVVYELSHRKNLIAQPTRLTQVLDNLISNAIKYSDRKKEESFVKVRTFNNAERFFIQVEDNGIGIPEERQAEVFGMFKRFHSGPVSGSGLGLYLIRKQIVKLGATITFESSPNGTVFYIEIPLGQDH